MSAIAGRIGGADAPDAPAETGARQERALTPAELAWIALLPCALLAVVAIAALGPPLGDLLFKPGSEPLWPTTWRAIDGHPEPTKHARYLIAMAAPFLLVAAVLVGARRELRLRQPTIRALAWTSQGLVLAFVLVAALGQYNLVFVNADRDLPPVFGVSALVVAALLVPLAIAVMRRQAVAERVASLVRETSGRRAACIAVAAVLAALWLLRAVTTDRLVEDIGQMNWAPNDVFAVINGRTNLVDYHVMYAKLLPYPTALVMQALGETAFVFTFTMATLNLLALLAVYATFRRIVTSSLLALGLFLPFVALSDGDGVLSTPATWPMRYGWAYLLAWMTVRHLDGLGPRRAWVLFFVGGLATIDNLEFGTAATLATLAALLCAQPPRSVRAGLRVVGEAAAGALAAVVLVSLFTLVRAGALPSLTLLMEWPRVFTRLGLFSMQMPNASLHLAVYATFVAAVALAAVRLVRAGVGAARERDELLLTSMLAWSGTFGLLAGLYYTGRSDDPKLIAMFSAWGFALVLLTVVVVRALAARGWRRPTVPQLLVLYAFALAVCWIFNFSPPNEQLGRLTRSMPDPTYRAAAERFVRERTDPGEAVVITMPEGFRIAHEVGVKNVSPYVIQNTIVQRSQLQTVIDAARREGAHSLFVPEPGSGLAEEGDTAIEQVAMYAEAGYQLVSIEPGFLELSDVGTPIPTTLTGPSE